MSQPTAVSLFAGVGGFDLAATNVGINVVAAVEIDAHARGVLAHQFPTTKLFDDVRKVTADDLLAAGFIPRGGFIFGGFPCQDLSVAGKRAGLDGERSGLFYEIVRLATELQPSWLVLENVPGLLSSNSGKDMGAVIGALVDIGYGIAYRVLDAQYFGVPQRRRRVFIVGHLGDDGRTPAQILAIGESSRRNTPTRKQTRQNPAGTTTDSTGNGYTPASHGHYRPGIGTLRANGGDLGGGSETMIVSERYAPETIRVSEASTSPRTNSSSGRQVMRLRSFGDYQPDMTSSTLQSRDHKGPTDLIVGLESQT